MKRTNSNEGLLKKMLILIKKHPGIRPSKLNQLLDRPHTASFRAVLIKKGLVKKTRKGSAVYYYAK